MILPTIAHKNDLKSHSISRKAEIQRTQKIIHKQSLWFGLLLRWNLFPHKVSTNTRFQYVP